MLDIRHFALSFAGAGIGYHLLSFLFSGGGMGSGVGILVGIPFGVFCGVLLADFLSLVGFKGYHAAGLILSFIPNLAVALFVVPVLDAVLGILPGQVRGFLDFLVLVTTCLACYSVLIKAKEAK